MVVFPFYDNCLSFFFELLYFLSFDFQRLITSLVSSKCPYLRHELFFIYVFINGLIPRTIITPRVSSALLVSVPTRIWYYGWNAEFLNNVVIFKTKVNFPHALVTLKAFMLFGYSICCLWAYLLNVIPETIDWLLFNAKFGSMSAIS